MRLIACSLVAILTACAAAPEADEVVALRAAFPDHAARVLGDAGDPFTDTAESFVTTSPAGTVGLPRDAAGSISLAFADFVIEVRQSHVVGMAVAEGGHVRYEGADGAVYWSRSGDGIEEWLHVRAPTPGVIAEYAVTGGRIEQRDAVVAILDDAGRERVRVSAPAAYARSGAPVRVALEADSERAQIRLVVAEVAPGEPEILVDPLWSAVGNMAVARRLHTATLLPDGKVLVAGGMGLAGALATCEIWDSRTGRWSPAGAMLAARSEHAAVLLGDGTILVSGGRDAAGTAIAGGERYDPILDQWSSVAAMAVPRAGHTLTLLRSGRVLAVGSGATAELFASNAWTATGSLQVGRNEHTATRLANGRVLVVGGRNANGFLSSAESYNETTGSFGIAATLPGPRASHTATLLRDGQVLIAGGRSAASSYLASAYRYDPQTPGFVAAGSLAAARAHHTATLLPDNRVLVVGGFNGVDYPATAEGFTPATGLWSSKPAIGRYQHAAVVLHEGRVLVAGGYGYTPNTSVGFTTTLAHAHVENPAFGHDTWTAGGELPWSFEGTGTLLPGGSVLAIGKTWTSSPLAPTYGATVLTAGGASPTQPMAYDVTSHATSLLLDGRVFVAGGNRFVWFGSSYSNAGPTSGAQIFDPATGLWSPTASMLHPRHHATATTMPNGKVLVVGGMGPNNAPPFDGLASWLPPPEVYDPATDSWTAIDGSGRYGHTANLMADGRVLVVGGSTYWDWEVGGLFPPTTEAAVFDPAVENFTWFSWTLEARCQHTATSLPDGRVLLAGGSQTYCDTTGFGTPTMEISDPVNLTWHPAGSMQESRMRHTATLLVNGMVMFTGGFRSGVTPPFARTTELYDPATALSSTSPNLDHPSALIPTLLQYSGVVVQLGWTDLDASAPYVPKAIWVYNEGRRATTPPVPTAMPTHAAPGDQLVVNGALWASAEATENAATDQPRLVLLRHDSETQVVAPLRAFAVGTATFALPATTLPGWYQARVVVNGVPSAAWALHVE